jgi:uroporphyrin-III C-methyltransferase
MTDTSDNPTTDTLPPPPPRPKKSRAGRWFLLLLLLLLSAASGATFYLWQQLEHNRALLHVQINKTAEQLSMIDQQINRLQQRLQEDIQTQLNEVQEQNKNLERSLKQVYAQQKTAASEEDWNIAEVLYLLNIANQRLVLAQDSTAALSALQSADKRLRQNRDPRFLVLREQLARDIMALRDLRQPDINGMALRLNNHIRGIEHLRLRQEWQSAPILSQDEQVKTAPQVNDWRSGMDAVWHEIRQLVEIRHHSGSDAALLATPQIYFLRQNLRLGLESARLFLVRRDTEQFREASAMVLTWLEKYYDSGAASVASLRQDLQHMQAQELTLTLPDISATLNALQELADIRLENATVLPPVDNTPVDKSPEDKSPEDKSPEDKSPEDKSPADKSPADKSPADKSLEDKSPADKSLEDKSLEDKSLEDKSLEDKSPEDKSPADKKSIDKATVNKADTP